MFFNKKSNNKDVYDEKLEEMNENIYDTDLNQYNEDLQRNLHEDYYGTEDDIYRKTYGDWQEMSGTQVIRKYIPTIILVAISFIFIMLGWGGKLLYLAGVLAIIVLIYIIVSLVVFKKEIKDVLRELKDFWTLSGKFVAKAGKSYSEATQYLYDKYIVDDPEGQLSEDNSYKGVNFDPYAHMREDLVRDEIEGGSRRRRPNDPDYIYHQNNLNKESGYKQFTENKYKESLKRMQEVQNLEDINKQIIFFDEETKQYKIADENQANISNKEPETDIIRGRKKIINHDLNYYTINPYNEIIYISKDEPKNLKIETKKIIDSEIRPVIMASTLKIVENGNNIELYLGDININTKKSPIEMKITHNNSIYLLECINLNNIIVEGNIEIEIM